MVRKVLFCMFFVILVTGYSQVGKVLFSEGRSVPQLLNYQGYLTDTLGIPIDDSLDMTFKIFDAVSSGTELCLKPGMMCRSKQVSLPLY